jgi:hypothetical protein
LWYSDFGMCEAGTQTSGYCEAWHGVEQLAGDTYISCQSWFAWAGAQNDTISQLLIYREKAFFMDRVAEALDSVSSVPGLNAEAAEFILQLHSLQRVPTEISSTTTGAISELEAAGADYPKEGAAVENIQGVLDDGEFSFSADLCELQDDPVLSSVCELNGYLRFNGLPCAGSPPLPLGCLWGLSLSPWVL